VKLAFVAVFRSAGYYRHRYVYSASWRSDRVRQGLRAMEGAEIAPVNGVPMRARETVLASMLKAGIYPPAETAAAESPSDWVRFQRRRMKGDEKPLVSVIRNAKKIMPKGTLLGIEIEHYPAGNNRALSAVSSDRTGRSLTDCVSDGSLRAGGLELRRLTWAGANGRLNGILSLAPILAGGTVDTRCGLHVHVDVRHLDMPGMGRPDSAACDAGETYDRLCKLYPILKRLVPPSRHRSTYCRWRNNRHESPDFDRGRDGNRYAALNFDSYAEHGTIEWRMQGGSTNPIKIESWALLCQFLTRWASIRDNSIPRNWDQFLAILPQWLASWCVLRRERLYGDLGPCSDRVLSAVESNEGGDN
jgi:hypothetical protein